MANLNKYFNLPRYIPIRARQLLRQNHPSVLYNKVRLGTNSNKLGEHHLPSRVTSLNVCVTGSKRHCKCERAGAEAIRILQMVRGQAEAEAAAAGKQRQRQRQRVSRGRISTLRPPATPQLPCIDLRSSNPSSVML